jgi:GDP-4-dehydro-6-deoxy-D-mannose reductase
MRDLLDQLCRLAAVEIAIELDAARLRPSDVPVIKGDATRLRSELGWAPRIHIDETLRDTLDWWRAEVRS